MMVDAVYLTNSNFLNSCFKGEPMRIIYRMRGKIKIKKKGIFAVIFIKQNFDAISSYLVHSIDHKLRLFAREAWWYVGVGGL